MATSQFQGATWSQEIYGHDATEALIQTSQILSNDNITRAIGDGSVVHVPRVSLHGQAAWVGEGQQIPQDTTSAEDMVAVVFSKIASYNVVPSEDIEDEAVDIWGTYGGALLRKLSRSVDLAFFSSAAETEVSPAGFMYSSSPQLVGALGVPSGITEATTLTLAEGSRSPIPSGTTITVTDWTGSVAAAATFTTSADVAVGDQTIPITSATPANNYPVGSRITIPAGAWKPDADTVDLDTLLEAEVQIAGQGGQADVVYMNAADYGALRTSKAQGSGAYLLSYFSNSDTTGRPVPMIGGMEVRLTAGLAPGNALVCDSSQILLGVRRELEIVVTPRGGAFFTSDSLGILATGRFGWDVGDRAGFVYISS